MSLIQRWALMHTHVPENVSEHSHQVAVIAHLLTVIHNHLTNENLNPEKSAPWLYFTKSAKQKCKMLILTQNIKPLNLQKNSRN